MRNPCGAELPRNVKPISQEMWAPFRCTEPEGHNGHHIARGVDYRDIKAEWPNAVKYSFKHWSLNDIIMDEFYNSLTDKDICPFDAMEHESMRMIVAYILENYTLTRQRKKECSSGQTYQKKSW